jgi:predicted DNA-binding protein (MmcQ/YjbR family)
MDRLEGVVARLPQAERVDVEAWDGEPTFRVNGKTFIFRSLDANGIGVKLPKEEAVAVVATDPNAEPTGYGLGRHGWISVAIPATTSATRWREIEEWIRTSYTLVAPKKLARAVLEEDQQPRVTRAVVGSPGRATPPSVGFSGGGRCSRAVFGVRAWCRDRPDGARRRQLDVEAEGSFKSPLSDAQSFATQARGQCCALRRRALR